jgi:glucose/mannose-6-phosphate isomerase
VLAGMGGSGLAAKVAKTYPSINVPFEIVQDYDLPSYVDSSTLFIASSYSGNTEETVSVLDQALGESRDDSKKPMIIVIASGGELEKMAKDKNLPLITIPSGYQPRMTLGYQFRALMEIFEKASLASGLTNQLDHIGDWLNTKVSEWAPTVPTSSNYAKQLALDIVGKSMVIYAGPKLSAVAYKWKISFNENAKNISWWNQYSEFNHNEFLGWTSHPIDKPYAVIELHSEFEHPRIKKRFAVTSKLLSGRRPAPEVIEYKGDSLLHQIVWLIALGDMVTLYVALLNNIDPTPVDLIETFKKKLNDN